MVKVVGRVWASKSRRRARATQEGSYVPLPPCNVIIITPIELPCFLLKGNVELAKTMKTNMLIKHFQHKKDLAG